MTEKKGRFWNLIQKNRKILECDRGSWNILEYGREKWDDFGGKSDDVSETVGKTPWTAKVSMVSKVLLRTPWTP